MSDQPAANTACQACVGSGSEGIIGRAKCFKCGGTGRVSRDVLADEYSLGFHEALVAEEAFKSGWDAALESLKPVADAVDPALVAGFDHPCKQTCSGWEQGRQRGLLERDEEVRQLRYLVGEFMARWNPEEISAISRDYMKNVTLIDEENRRLTDQVAEAKREKEVVEFEMKKLYDCALADLRRVEDENKRLRKALQFIVNGCLVPPDGGSPCLEDAIAAATEALKACSDCHGTGKVEVGSGYASDSGGELTREDDCPKCASSPVEPKASAIDEDECDFTEVYSENHTYSKHSANCRRCAKAQMNTDLAHAKENE